MDELVYLFQHRFSISKQTSASVRTPSRVDGNDASNQNGRIHTQSPRSADPNNADIASTSKDHVDINRTTKPISLPEPKDLTIEEIKRRLRDPSRPILLVGESETLSTTLALAAMRGSFHNIWSSCYPADSEPPPSITDFIQMMLENIIRCKEKFRRQHYATLIAELIHMANSEVDALLIRLSLKVDATKLSDPDIPPESKGIIWFNFPWSQTGTATLLQEFVKSAAGQQTKGQLLILGLTRNPIWTPRYELPALLNISNLKAAGYNKPHKENIKEVESFLGECVKLGYRHTSSNGKDAHFYIVDDGSDLYILVKEY